MNEGDRLNVDPFVNFFPYCRIYFSLCLNPYGLGHNGGTSGAPLKPLRDDSALRALSSLIKFNSMSLIKLGEKSRQLVTCTFSVVTMSPLFIKLFTAFIIILITYLNKTIFYTL